MTRRLLLFALLFLAAAVPAVAVSTLSVQPVSTAWTSLGAGPMQVQVPQNGGALAVVIADSTPSAVTSPSFTVLPGNPPLQIPTTSNVYVRALSLRATIAVYAPVTAQGGGGGGGGSVTQGTSPWVDNITQWASTALGAPTTYGTAPTGIVPGTNAFVTNFPATQAVTWTNQTVAATQSGAWSVSVSNFPATQPVSGTVTANLGTLNGAATAANQTLTSGPVAPGTAATNSALAGLVYNSTAPTVGNGQQVAQQADAAGNTKVNIAAGSIANTGFNALQGGAANATGNPFYTFDTGQTASNATDGQATRTDNGHVNDYLYGWNGASYDRVKTSNGAIDVNQYGTSKVADGISPVVTQSGTSAIGKASGGNLYGAQAMALATNAAQEYLVCINAATVPSAGGAITAVDWAPVGQGAAAIGYSGAINYGAGPGNAYSTGITCLVTTSMTTYTAGSAAIVQVRAR